MDAADGALVAHLVQHPLAPIADLCAAAGLTRNAVKARLARLAQRRVLDGFMAVPNPALFGLTGVVNVFPAPDGPHPSKEKLLAIEEVVSLSVNHDDVLAVITMQRDAAKGPPSDLVRLVGAPPARTFVQRAPPLVPPGAALSPAQWRVLAALVVDPRGSTSAIAQRAGVTTKVARRHREGLVQGNHVLVQPVLLDGLASAGGVFFEIYAQGTAAAEPARIQRAMGQSWVIDVLQDPQGVLLLGRSEEAAGGAVAALNRVKAMSGVEHAELIFGRDFAWAPQKLVAWCHAAAGASRAGR